VAEANGGTSGVDLIGTVFTMVELIAYQEGSVVSRTIAKKDSGSITVFAFDQGQGLSEHTTPFDALVHVLDGEAEIVISGESHRVGAGQMIIMPANEPHALNAVERFKMVLVMLKS
jgi:quercetin dioxygenase-like cupin family protein